jgi:hypothetical protein
MSNRLFMLASAAVMLATLLLAAPSREARGQTASPSASGFAVLELFTSEGCSSCPAADRTLAALAEAYADRAVFPLSFHVDYWDRLGWRDPFSSATFSDRQRRYARTLSSHRVYTPQLVVNGQLDVVGSRAGTIRRWVDRALQGHAEASIAFEVKREGRRLRTHHRASGGPASARVVLLLTQDHASQHVPRGENAGRALTHVHVVRELRTAGRAAQVRWTLPDDVEPSSVELIALLQDPDSGHIHAAARAR